MRYSLLELNIHQILFSPLFTRTHIIAYLSFRCSQVDQKPVHRYHHQFLISDNQLYCHTEVQDVVTGPSIFLKAFLSEKSANCTGVFKNFIFKEKSNMPSQEGEAGQFYSAWNEERRHFSLRANVWSMRCYKNYYFTRLTRVFSVCLIVVLRWNHIPKTALHPS